jgi:hypothetical protein
MSKRKPVLSGPEPAGRPIPADPDAGLFASEAAYLAGVSPRTLENLRLRGGGPAYYKIRHGVRYRRRAVVDWIDARTRTSTAQHAAA